MNFLEAILEHTRDEVARRKESVPEELLRGRPLYARTPLSLSEALRRKSPAVIAEIKRASPSKGVIARDVDTARIARQYEGAGAAALSVLTEEKYFLGSLNDLEEARRAASIPILRKDFIVDPYQVHESKSSGADAILLIAAALAPGDLAALHEEAGSIGLETLVEIHTRAELESLRGLSLPLIGINNRNLVTLETDTRLAASLGPVLPRGSLGVGESGIRSGSDVRRLSECGLRAFLVGEHFMSSDDPGRALSELIRNSGDPA